jgi:TPP-dependent pyruvate/acetoin dehydrogenase alpha subunit
MSTMAAPSAHGSPTTDDATRIARAIVRSRAVDGFVADLSRRGLVSMVPPARAIDGHLYGALAALRPADWTFGDVRMGAVALERGLPLQDWLAQILGTASSAHAGHAIPAEPTAASVRCVSTSSLLGTQLAQAAGVAHAMAHRKTDEVVLSWFGAGAAAVGDAHVAFNFAGVFGSPAIFYFCSSGDAAADRDRLSGESFADRADAYGLASAVVDGGDPLAVRDVVAAAAERARAGGGATLIDGRTTTDPLLSLAPDAADVEAWTHELTNELRSLTERLQGEAPPAVASLFDHVFAEPTARLQEQRTQLQAHRARFASGEIDG